MESEIVRKDGMIYHLIDVHLEVNSEYDAHYMTDKVLLSTARVDCYQIMQSLPRWKAQKQPTPFKGAKAQLVISYSEYEP